MVCTQMLLKKLFINSTKFSKAYLKAGRIKDANRLLKQLSNSAIEEERFLDASYFYWLLSKQYLDLYYEKEWVA